MRHLDFYLTARLLLAAGAEHHQARDPGADLLRIRHLSFIIRHLSFIPDAGSARYAAASWFMMVRWGV